MADEHKLESDENLQFLEALQVSHLPRPYDFVFEQLLFQVPRGAMLFVLANLLKR